MLQDVLHATRSLLCTSTNETPHERFLAFPSKSMLGKSMPNWFLNPGAVLLRKFVRNKGDPFCDEVELIEADPSFVRIRHTNGIETTVSTKDLAPFPRKLCPTTTKDQKQSILSPVEQMPAELEANRETETVSSSCETSSENNASECLFDNNTITPQLRRSTRIKKKPDRYGDTTYD